VVENGLIGVAVNAASSQIHSITQWLSAGATTLPLLFTASKFCFQNAVLKFCTYNLHLDLCTLSLSVVCKSLLPHIGTSSQQQSPFYSGGLLIIPTNKWIFYSILLFLCFIFSFQAFLFMAIITINLCQRVTMIQSSRDWRLDPGVNLPASSAGCHPCYT
jgi:hypothetical protein